MYIYIYLLSSPIPSPYSKQLYNCIIVISIIWKSGPTTYLRPHRAPAAPPHASGPTEYKCLYSCIGQLRLYLKQLVRIIIPKIVTILLVMIMYIHINICIYIPPPPQYVSLLLILYICNVNCTNNDINHMNKRAQRAPAAPLCINGQYYVLNS